MSAEHEAVLTQGITQVCARAGLAALKVEADGAEVRRQEAGAAVGFLAALEAALRALVSPGDGQGEHDGAPWDYVSDVPDAFGLASDASPDDLGAAVRNLVNQPDVTVVLLGPEDYALEENPRKVFPPEHGETTDGNWVFYVALDALSSVQWMIVDKAGKRDAYCYGHD